MLLPWIERESSWRVLPIAIVLALTVRYLLWRVTVTIPPMRDTTDFIVGCLFFAIECAAVTGSIISYITLDPHQAAFIRSRRQQRMAVLARKAAFGRCLHLHLQ